MEQPSTSSPAAPPPPPRRPPTKVRLRRQRLEALLQELRQTLDGMGDADLGASLSDADAGSEAPEYGDGEGGGDDDDDGDSAASMASDSDRATDQVFDLLKSRFESPEFLQEFHEIQKSVCQNVELDKSWDVIKAGDVWEDDDDNGYVLVKPEDAAEGIAFFVATYLSTLTKTKELSPDRLQKALKKTFSAEKRKGKLRKAWDGTKVIYNVASWGATAVGIYNNQSILKAAGTAIQMSWRVVSKFL
ncbi:hypothetical protein CFC21_017969 [Triticum aestivum]|uniref:Uncharacterized protein n=3 Tax=Triticum TaxID=4564 RepID=A0A9R0TRN0_TRITD|nr:uncharacterized protein LOC119301887 isoform X2 [Triticum dicoccoides]KAF7002481.1 hypothetical protein CFC21_017969 [Triticum aestivum]VAI18522.1 unnamed protein product [Triticum turgidum subsp. durum]